jgi:hypothetical protein
MTTKKECMTPQQFANSLTKTGLEGILRHNTKLLKEIEEFDKKFGEQGKSARAIAKTGIIKKIKNINEAIAIREEQHENG